MANGIEDLHSQKKSIPIYIERLDFSYLIRQLLIMALERAFTIMIFLPIFMLFPLFTHILAILSCSTMNFNMRNYKSRDKTLHRNACFRCYMIESFVHLYFSRTCHDHHQMKGSILSLQYTQFPYNSLHSAVFL